MTADCERAQRGADPSGVSLVSSDAPLGAEEVMRGRHAAVVTPDDIAWLVAHLQAAVAASPAVWAGRGLTLVQLTARHLVGTLAPVGTVALSQRTSSPRLKPAKQAPQSLWRTMTNRHPSPAAGHLGGADDKLERADRSMQQCRARKWWVTSWAGIPSRRHRRRS